MNSPILEMEMERLDSEIEKTKKKFYSAVLGKKRRVKRTWLEISALTNAHLLQMLPYRAMLGHVAKLAEERDKIIVEMLASQEDMNSDDDGESGKSTMGENESDKNCDSDLSKLTMENALASSQNVCVAGSTQKGRDEAVQTEESSFPSQTE